MAAPAPRHQATWANVAAGAEARLGLAEFLLTCDDRETCAQSAVEWLGDHAGMRQAVCLVVQEGEPRRLAGIAGFGVPTSKVKQFSMAVEDSEHPLVQALMGSQPVSFRPVGDDLPLRLGVGTGYREFRAIPLAPLELDEQLGVGVLLASAEDATQVTREVRWVARVLGEKLLRLRARDVLADAEHRYRRERTLLYSIVNAVTDPILLTDTEGKLILANNRAEKLFAAREEESEGRRRAVALNNMLFSSALSFSAIEDNPSSVRRELLVVDPTEGSDLLFELMSTVAADAREGTGIVSILRNVTDLRRATEEIEENYRKLRVAESDIRAERDRLDLIIDSMADPVVATNPSGEIMLMNTPAERLFTAGTNVGKDAQRAVRTNDAVFSSFISNLFAAQGLRWKGELNLTDPQTGVLVPVEAIAGKVLSEHGELTAIVTVLHDRTDAMEKAQLYDQVKRAADELEAKVQAATGELAQQNELLRRQAIALEQASALKSQFLANMSHEFRTPLNAVLGYTQMLLQGVSGDLTTPQLRSMSRIESNGKHLLAIINDILDISRIEAGKMPLHLSEFDLDVLVAEVMAEMEPIISRSKLAVTTEIAPRLPRMRSDRQKVKQIVLNFLANAVKFTHQGSIKVKAAYLPGKIVSISVSDTGIGIADQDREKVFQDFQQVDSSPTRFYGGAGLGLSICRRLSNMLGGDIFLESKLGKGSTFALRVPARLRR